MKKLWNARKDSEGVSPVIATILMVAITVVLAAILMVMVMGMTGSSEAAVGLEQTDDYKVKITTSTTVMAISDVEIRIGTTVITGTWNTASVLVNSVFTVTGTPAAWVSGATVNLYYQGTLAGTVVLTSPAAP